MDNLVIYFVVSFFGAFLIFKMINKRRLGKYLLKHVVELEAETKLISVNIARLSYKVEVSFLINGQTIVERMSVDNYEWHPGQAIGTCKKYPVLVDPANPNKFLFNVHKFQLKNASNDSVQNFLERNKAEEPFKDK